MLFNHNKCYNKNYTKVRIVSSMSKKIKKVMRKTGIKNRDKTILLGLGKQHDNLFKNETI